MFSFIVPAHNEEASIGAALAAIGTAARTLELEFEMIVVDDASTDTTAACALQAGAIVVPVAVRQISRARNAGAAQAQGATLVFVDADTLVSVEVLRALALAIEGGAIGGGCAVRFDEPIPYWVKFFMPLGLWYQRRARLAAGCFFFCSKAVFERVGGFREDVFAAEEIFLSRLLQEHGEFVVLREQVLTSGRKFRTHSFSQILRMAARLIWAGRVGLRNRKALDLWYGPRLPDPRSRDGTR